MRVFSIMLLCSLVIGCSTYAPENYLGEDAGYVVMAIGARNGTEYSTYTFYVKNLENSEAYSFRYLQNNSAWAQEKRQLFFERRFFDPF